MAPIDVGSMQFNTAYLRSLERYGITPEAVAQPGCYAYYLAAWRIKRHIVYDKNGDIWTKVANYHSYTPRYNAIYRAGIMRLANKWAIWLNERMNNVAPTTVASTATPGNQQPVSVSAQTRQQRPYLPSVSPQQQPRLVQQPTQQQPRQQQQPRYSA